MIVRFADNLSFSLGKKKNKPNWQKAKGKSKLSQTIQQMWRQHGIFIKGGKPLQVHTKKRAEPLIWSPSALVKQQKYNSYNLGWKYGKQSFALPDWPWWQDNCPIHSCRFQCDREQTSYLNSPSRKTKVHYFSKLSLISLLHRKIN